MTVTPPPASEREMLRAFEAWNPDSLAARSGSFEGYVQAIAHARFVMRRILRLLDDQARSHDLEPMQHQALLQVYGSEYEITVSQLAERLSVIGPYASRLVTHLERRGLVERHQYKEDHRVVHVGATPSGIDLLRSIDSAVYQDIKRFQGELSENGKVGALGIFAFYVGLDTDSVLAAHLRDSLRAVTEDGVTTRTAS